MHALPWKLVKMNLPSWPQDDHEPSFKLFSLPSKMIKGVRPNLTMMDASRTKREAIKRMEGCKEG